MDERSTWQVFKDLWKSRKFWVLLASLVSCWGAFFLGEVEVLNALQLTIAAFAIFSTGVAIEDAGRHIGD